MAQLERDAAIVKRVFRRHDKLGDGTVDREMLWKVLQTLPSRISLPTFLNLLQQIGYDGGRVNYVRFLDRLFSSENMLVEDSASDTEDMTQPCAGWRRLLLSLAKFHTTCDEAVAGRTHYAPAAYGNETDCIVCYSAPPSVLILPCRHLQVCRCCAPLLSRCPSCRADIQALARPSWDIQGNA
ncbi:rngB [Symbiodinium pilosum]|uniref:RngB protein n=1 Tax=Symbiodinium pilosum TaxID=2952 RepID=A0A812XVY9_SYMPI|nr:rngB [Symbiodinium pilosum]